MTRDPDQHPGFAPIPPVVVRTTWTRARRPVRPRPSRDRRRRRPAAEPEPAPEKTPTGSLRARPVPSSPAGRGWRFGCGSGRSGSGGSAGSGGAGGSGPVGPDPFRPSVEALRVRDSGPRYGVRASGVGEVDAFGAPRGSGARHGAGPGQVGPVDRPARVPGVPPGRRSGSDALVLPVGPALPVDLVFPVGPGVRAGSAPGAGSGFRRLRPPGMPPGVGSGSTRSVPRWRAVPRSQRGGSVHRLRHGSSPAPRPGSAAAPNSNRPPPLPAPTGRLPARRDRRRQPSGPRGPGPRGPQDTPAEGFPSPYAPGGRPDVPSAPRTSRPECRGPAILSPPRTPRRARTTPPDPSPHRPRRPPTSRSPATSRRRPDVGPGDRFDAGAARKDRTCCARPYVPGRDRRCPGRPTWVCPGTPCHASRRYRQARPPAGPARAQARTGARHRDARAVRRQIRAAKKKAAPR